MFQMNQKEGKDIEKHFRELEFFFVKIASLGALVSRQEKIVQMVWSLLESLCHISLVSGNLKLTYDQMRSSVRSEIKYEKQKRYAERQARIITNDRSSL